MENVFEALENSGKCMKSSKRIYICCEQNVTNQYDQIKANHPYNESINIMLIIKNKPLDITTRELPLLAPAIELM